MGALTIAEIARTLPGPPSPDLMSRLTASGVTTSGDLLASWARRDFDDLSDGDTARLGDLVAHAALATLDATPPLRARLVEAGLRRRRRPQATHRLERREQAARPARALPGSHRPRDQPHRRRRGDDQVLQYRATFGRDIPEIVTLAETISQWRNEIAAAVLLGISNAAAEAVNRVTKLLYRTAFGMRNVSHQQRRASYAASRSTRPDWLPAVATHPKSA